MDHPPPETFRDAVNVEDPVRWTPRADRPSTMVGEHGVVAHAEPGDRRFSLGATFLGWSVAAFFTVVFVAVSAILFGTNTAAGATTEVTFTQAGIVSLVAYLVATFAAYLIGGYAAGRIALWDGVQHGMLIVGWSVLFAGVALAMTVALGDVGAFIGLPITIGAFTVATLIGAILTVAVMLAGGALGGNLGERYHARVHGVAPRRREARRMKGRPL